MIGFQNLHLKSINIKGIGMILSMNESCTSWSLPYSPLTNTLFHCANLFKLAIEHVFCIVGDSGALSVTVSNSTYIISD